MFTTTGSSKPCVRPAPHPAVLGLADASTPFALPDSRGRYVSSLDLLERGPLVLSFYRGGWCPYCVTEMTAWAEKVAPRLPRGLGASFMAVTGETGGGRGSRRKLDLDGEILVDVDHGLGAANGPCRSCPRTRSAKPISTSASTCPSESTGSDAWFIWVPATYVIDRQGIARPLR